MVLHNNKWDRRAKYKYLKKHGIVESPAAKQQNEPSSPAGNEQQRLQAPENSSLETGDAGPLSEVRGAEEEEVDSEEPSGSGEQLEIQGLELPEFEDDPDQDALIREHIAKQGQTYARQKDAHTPAPSAEDDALFRQAAVNLERSRLNARVKRIGDRNKGKAAPVELDSDSEFEDFMEKADARDNDHNSRPAPAAGRDAAAVDSGLDQGKVAFIDNLLQ